MSFSEGNLRNLVKVAIEHGASDIHIRSEERPLFRILGELVPIETKTFQQKDLKELIQILLRQNDKEILIDKTNELDGSYSIENLCRLRFHFFRFNNNNQIGIIFRIVKQEIPSLEELNMPKVIKSIASQKRGLVLVTGPTGSGKSTTLAAMIDFINKNRHQHIITVEDPIEFLHPQIKSRISQREIGIDTDSFTTALKSALRQDPDIILIGEIRDRETLEMALKASETGHMVYSTMHTTDTISTIARIISMYTPYEQDTIKKRLAISLHSIIGQRMLKGLDKSNVVIAQEIMINGPGIKECILGDVPLERIDEIIKNGFSNDELRTQSFDQNIKELYENNIIDQETALKNVRSQADFLQNLIID